jgi:hypothetical protein
MNSGFNLRYLPLFLCVTLFSWDGKAQNNGFEFGKITYEELDLQNYVNDTSAVALVMNEFGEAFFDPSDLNKIIFQYHTKIKILKEGGKVYANFQIPTRKNNGREEVVSSVKASSFNRTGNAWKETELLNKNIFRENTNEFYSLTKFAVPDVRVGSVIEITYQLETPFTYNFIPWEFQSSIPKLKSEFWASFPAYYEYAVTLKGYLRLTKNEGKVIKGCVGNGSLKADCSLLKFGMERIPAFKEEDYMTAKKDFVSSIFFELDKITQQNGQVNKVTSEWKDVERELDQHEDFGRQIKKAKNAFADKAIELKAATKEPLALATSVHNYVKSNFTWTGTFGKYANSGIKKLLETKRGNVGDLNLFLIGALLEAGLETEAVLLSTRDNGLPIKHHPVMSDFNYLLARVKIADNYYLLDATSPLHPFGFVPAHCLNGQGRAIGKTSAWIDIKPTEKNRKVTDLKIRLNEDGQMTGMATISHFGYSAFNRRSEFLKAENLNDYVQRQSKKWNEIEIKNYVVQNDYDLAQPFVEKFELTFNEQLPNASIIYLPVFLLGRTEKNPFTSNERSYPVDFGAPIEETYVLTVEYPPSFHAEDLPQNAAYALTQTGGRCLFNLSDLEGKIAATCSFSINKSVFSAAEYGSLKEFFNRFVTIQQSQIVLKK